MYICLKIFIANKKRILNISVLNNRYIRSKGPKSSACWGRAKEVICFIRYIVMAALNTAHLWHGHVGTAPGEPVAGASIFNDIQILFCQSKTIVLLWGMIWKKNYQVLKGLRGFSVQVQESHPRKGIYEVRSGKRFAPIAGTSPQKCYTGRVRVVFGDVFRPVYARGLAGRQGIRYQPHYALATLCC